MSRNLTDASDGFLTGQRFLIHDRDPLFTVAFRETLAASGVQAVRLPPRSPNLNAFAERFVRTIKESCLDQMILVGEASLRRAVGEFIEHYHHERNHQGLGNQLIAPVATQTSRRLPHCVSGAAGGRRFAIVPTGSSLGRSVVRRPSTFSRRSIPAISGA